VYWKFAATLDGQTAAADGSSKWITSEAARADVATLRAQCDAIIVGAGTVRIDDPELTARTDPPPPRQPQRIVLGDIPEGARVLPARSFRGPLGDLLDELGEQGFLQVLIEGGATTAHEALEAGLVDRVVAYVAPAIMGGDDGAPILRGAGASSMAEVRRGQLISVMQVGNDLRVEVSL
jgi:diaminohydroxyphosphoribosylaminopyrimidine deaminase/5-amino-6-(5-phosphoribosylamino)uracil reductase